MYIAMNRFQIAAGKEGAFEAVWKDRHSLLGNVPGFRRFDLLRGSTEENVTTYMAHAEWDSEETFRAWTESEEFRKAHGRSNLEPGVILEHPKFEGFQGVGL